MSQSEGAPEPESLVRGRALHIFVAVVTTAAVVGFVAGTRPWAEREPVAGELLAPEAVVERAGAEPAMPARDYGAIANAPLRTTDGGAAEVEGRALGPLGLAGPAWVSEEAREQALGERAERRAFAGAPPVIPHPIEEAGPLSCMACHDDGAWIGGRIAPPMSHAYQSSCTQCHVPVEASGPHVAAERAGAVENEFSGATEPRASEPHWPGAPPTMPHRAHMRERCDSCHGSAGREGLRASHPWRFACTQCHAESDAPAAFGGAVRALEEGLPPIEVEGGTDE